MPLPTRQQLGGIRLQPLRVPPTPNNTPVSTPPSSPTKSLTTLTIETTKKLKKMAKTKNPRSEKRHLVRWNDNMDKQLLLSVQYACNSTGLAIPWDKVGNIMGEGITGGAIVQHLAKVRGKLIVLGLAVPPTLRRGGGAASQISMAVSPSVPKVKATTPKKGNAPENSITKKAVSTRSKKQVNKRVAGSDDSDEDDDEAWDNDESDGEYGEPAAKRTKPNTKGPMRRMIKEESGDEEVVDRKRKYKSSKSSSKALSAHGTHDINGKPTGGYSNVKNEPKDGRVGAGESWLALDDDHPKTGGKALPKKKSLVVSLPVTPVKTSPAEAVKEQDDDDMSDYESDDEVVGAGVENVVDGSHGLSNELMGQDFSGFPINQDFHGYDDQAFDDPFPDHLNHTNVFNNSYPSVQGSNGVFDDDDFSQNQSLNGGFQSFNMHGGTGGIPYPIQTSWATTPGLTAQSSNNTSVNQTPAGPSAGADFDTGYFNTSQFDLGDFDGPFDGAFGDSNMDFSGNDASDDLFNAGNFDGNFVNGDMFGNQYYGN